MRESRTSFVVIVCGCFVVVVPMCRSTFVVVVDVERGLVGEKGGEKGQPRAKYDGPPTPIIRQSPGINRPYYNEVRTTLQGTSLKTTIRTGFSDSKMG